MTPASKGLTREEALRMVRERISGVGGRGTADGRLADLLLSIDRSARKSEWEARGGPELERRLQVRIRECPCVGDADFTHVARCEECMADAEAIARTESPATAPASEEGR